jgi:hypothetical protein
LEEILRILSDFLGYARSLVSNSFKGSKISKDKHRPLVKLIVTNLVLRSILIKSSPFLATTYWSLSQEARFKLEGGGAAGFGGGEGWLGKDGGDFGGGGKGVFGDIGGKSATIGIGGVCGGEGGE